MYKGWWINSVLSTNRNFKLLSATYLCTCLYVVHCTSASTNGQKVPLWSLKIKIQYIQCIIIIMRVGLTNFAISQTIFTSTVTSKICKKCLQLFRHKIIKSFKTCSQLYTLFTFFPVLFSLYWLGSEFILQLF